MRSYRKVSRKLRSVREFARGLAATDHPLLVHIVPIRRCNIDCGYCNEFDKVSDPIPLETMLARLDKLAGLGTSVVAFSGGEPMLHPDLDTLIRRIRLRGMIAGLITNGYLLSPKRIHALNDAGLDYLQISIDNVEPDEISKKSLRLLDKKLQWLAEHAHFDVNINSVVGGGIKNPEDARTINRRARELGFSTSIGIIHDGSGLLKPLGAAERAVFDEVMRLINGQRQVVKNLYSGIRNFQTNLADGKPNQWQCRAGARYLYICEDGLVHWCSQQRGCPGVPLATYTIADIRRELLAPKWCAPMCTIGCVHRVSTMDFWRKPQRQDAGIAPGPVSEVS
ncbi:MAG TPA: radical SAM protein [Vicinamibacterales bacterium]|jgi:MoaA/NifB/PqqE/SkfB family radical SAM enzyme|nr:radical SAM protein [Vicinamibacterales bacterium]